MSTRIRLVALLLTALLAAPALATPGPDPNTITLFAAPGLAPGEMYMGVLAEAGARFVIQADPGLPAAPERVAGGSCDTTPGIAWLCEGGGDAGSTHVGVLIRWAQVPRSVVLMQNGHTLTWWRPDVAPPPTATLTPLPTPEPPPPVPRSWLPVTLDGDMAASDIHALLGQRGDEPAPALTFAWGPPATVTWRGPGLLRAGDYLLDYSQDDAERTVTMGGDVAATPFPGMVLRVTSWGGDELARTVVPARPLPARLYLPLVGG
jgi:hypothetical protein